MADPTPSPPAPRRRSPRRALLWALVLAAAFALPRVLCLRGISQAAIVEFADMADHLYFLDLVGKRRTLSPEQVDDPFFKAFPETQPRMLAIQWPPGLYQLVALFSPALGPGSLWIPLLTNALFTLLMVLGVIGLGPSLARGDPQSGRRIGHWAALLCLLSPPLLASSWYFSLDYPLIGMTTVGLWLLWRSERFGRWLPTLAFGVWSALGTLIKPTYALYLVGPAAYLAVAGLIKPTVSKTKEESTPGHGWRPRLLLAARLLFGLGLSLGLVLWLYAPDWRAIGVETRVHFIDRTLPGATTDPFTLEWFVANLKFAVANYPWPLLIPLAPGLVLLHLRRGVAGRGFHLALLYSTYLFLTLLANKMERYIQPVYPVFCLLTVFWIVVLIPRRWLQHALLGAVALLFAGTTLYTHLERPLPWLPEPRQAIPMESAYHPFRYEFHTPDAAQLARLRTYRWDSECQFQPLVDQIARWVRARAPQKRPVGMIYLRNLRQMKVGHPPMPFRKLIPAVVQTIRDRFVIVGNLHLMERIPPPLLHIPTLIVVHGPEVTPEALHPELRRLERRTVQVRCRGGQRYPFSLTLAQPLQPL